MFRDLCGKKHSNNDNPIMDELIREHIVGRNITAELVKSAAEYQRGDPAALPLVMQNLRKLVE